MNKSLILLVLVCAALSLAGVKIERTKYDYDVYQVFICDSSLAEAESKAATCKNAKYLDHVSYCSCIGVSKEMRDQVLKKTRCRQSVDPGPDGLPKWEWKEDTCQAPKSIVYQCNCVGNAEKKN